MRRVAWLVLAAQAQSDQRREAANHQSVGIDEYPLLLDLGGLGRVGFHSLIRKSVNQRRRIGIEEALVKKNAANSIFLVCGIRIPYPLGLTCRYHRERLD